MQTSIQYHFIHEYIFLILYNMYTFYTLTHVPFILFDLIYQAVWKRFLKGIFEWDIATILIKEISYSYQKIIVYL